MKRRIRITLFGSFYGGYYLLEQLLDGALKHLVEVVGVATDDPTQSYVNPNKRIWSYPHEPAEEQLVCNLATDFGIELFRGRIKTDYFYEMFQENWRHDICLMATIGQLIPPDLINYPTLGIYNIHHSSENGWPSYPGPNPIQQMIDDNCQYVVITMHIVNERFDDGPLVVHSPRISIPANATPVTVHRHTWPKVTRYFVKYIRRIILNSIVHYRTAA